MIRALKHLRHAIAAWLAPGMAERAERCAVAELNAQWALRAVTDIKKLETNANG